MRTFLRIRKVYMTLFETLIAVSLLSILLVFVFGFFRQLSEMIRVSEQIQKKSFQMRYLESRLGFIFERIVNDNKKVRSFYFYTQPPHKDFSESFSLIFTFDNGVRLDPSFSGEVLARLYVDSDHRLCLAVWPLHISEPMQYLHEEILLNHVEDLAFSFYAAPPRASGITTPQRDPQKKIPKKDEWQDEWLITYDQMPCIIKIFVKVAKNPEELKHHRKGEKMNTNDLAFHFVLPTTKDAIYYPKDIP
jgi:hypothetical protein